MTGSATPELTMYYREGCHLCDDMAFSLREMIAGKECSVEYVDIDRDEELRQRFNADVPVLCSGEETLCQHFLDQETLARWLARLEP